jgi:chaperonin GroES
MTAKNIKPLGNRVLVKRSEAKTTKGGILLPESAQEKPRQGEIVAVGPGKYDKDGVVQKVPLQVGDKVLFSAYGGTDVPSDKEKEYLILSLEDILAVIN